MDTIGERIRHARLVRGLTADALGRLVGGIQRSSVIQWEQGHTNPKTDRLAQIARALHVRAEWLATGYGDSGLTPTREDRTIGTEVPLLGISDIIARRIPESPQIARSYFPAGKRAVAHLLQGRTLEPIVAAGSMIVIAPDIQAEPGSLIAAVVSGRLALGRLEIEPGAKRKEVWYIAPVAPGLARMPIVPADLLGVISEFGTRLSLHDPQD